MTKMSRREFTEKVLAAAGTNEITAIHAFGVAWRKARTEKRTITLLEQERMWAEEARKALMGGV